MAEADSPDPKSDGEGKTEDDESSHRDKPNELKLKAGKLSIEASSVDESVDDLVDILSPEMKNLMEYQIRGELQVIEEEDLHGIFLGDD